MEEWRKLAPAVHNTLDVDHIVNETQQDHIAAHHAQAGVRPYVRPQLIKHRAFPDEFDCGVYLTDEAHSAARTVGCDVLGDRVQVVLYRFRVKDNPLVGLTGRVGDRLVFSLKPFHHLVGGHIRPVLLASLLPKLTQLGDAVLLKLALMRPVAQCVAHNLAR
jgi:hypothetical protein